MNTSPGTVRKMKSGRWQARYKNEDGRYVPAPMTYPTKTDAKKFLAVRQAEAIRGTWQVKTRDGVTVSDYAERWISERRLKVTTQANYRGLLARYVAPTLGSVPVTDLTPAMIRTWHADLRTQLKASTSAVADRMRAAGREPRASTSRTGEASVARAYAFLHAVLATAEDDGLVERNPCRIRGARANHTAERPTASVDEVLAIAEVIAPRYRVAVLFAAFTGLRIGEQAELRWADCDIEAGHRYPAIHVRRRIAFLPDGTPDVDLPKSRAGVRSVAIDTALAADLRRYRAEFRSDAGPGDLVFCRSSGGPINRASFTQTWRKAFAAVGRDDLTWHDLRHTGQTLAALSGATEAELMHRAGHSTAAAARRYLHTTTEHGRDVATRLGALRQRHSTPSGTTAEQAQATAGRV